MAVDMFLKLEGVDGESQDDKHKKEIEVLSFSWGETQPLAMAASTAGSLTSGRVSIGEFVVSKAIDCASPKLYLGCADGTHFKSARLELCRAGGDKQPYMEYKMTDVVVSSIRAGGSGYGETVPLEEVSFSFGKIEWKYIQTKVEGGKGSGQVAAGWDLKQNKKV